MGDACQLAVGYRAGILRALRRNKTAFMTASVYTDTDTNAGTDTDRDKDSE